MARDIEGPPGSISASALEAYSDCPRKWAWRKLDGITLPSGPAAEFGTLVHEQIERWLKHGIPFDLTTEAGECALACLHILPKPGTPGMMVENPFILEAWGFKFFGFKDIEFPNRIVTDDLGFDPPLFIPEIWDHKTSSNPTKWGLTTETLPDNIQASLYAAHSMISVGANECDLVWNYLKSKPSYKNSPVRLRVTRERIEPTLERIKRLAGEMTQIRLSGLRALDLPFNPLACEGYGGCPYRANCNLSASDRMKAIMSNPASQQEKDELMARLAAKRAAETGGAAPGAINPPPPPVNAGWQKSPDGAYHLNPATNGWEPIPAAPPPPPAPNGNPAAPVPPPPANGRKAGRPKLPRDANGKIIRTEGSSGVREQLMAVFGMLADILEENFENE